MKKEKIHNLLLFILIFLVILCIVLIKPLNNLDEIWNYNFARSIANGLVPYKEFNMLQMPLLPIICGIVLKFISNELVVMRILASLLCSTIFYITYKVFTILKLKKEIAIIFIFAIGCLFYNLVCIDYNYATLLLNLGIIYKEIKEYRKDNIFLKENYKNDLILGILAGLTVTLKQTTGLFICIALLGNKLLFVRKKEEFIIYIKSFGIRLIGVLIPVSVMIAYLLFNNAFSDFISYTIKGVSGFSNYIPYIKLIKFDVIGILSIVVPITFVYMWLRTICFEKDKISYIFLVYGLAMFVVCFPISDRIHFLIGSFPTISLILYKLYTLLRKKCGKYIKLYNINYAVITIYSVSVVITLCIIITSIYTIYNYFINNNYSISLKHYKYIPIDDKFEKEITNVKDYINSAETDVKILDATAAVYMIPNEKYNKNYDMLLKGNLGYKGEEKIIEEIKESNNTRYLILKDRYSKNWQTPLNVITYVKNNKTKIGEIEKFDIYE